jgi:prepilin-type processing-associated H-X9-DG protein
MNETNIESPIPTMPEPPRLPQRATRAVVSYATPQPSNNAAVLSLIFGLLLVIPFVPGILAIVFGRRGIKAANEQAAGRERLARLGIILGVLNIALSLAMAATLPFALMRARRAAMTVACASNLRSIGQLAMIYATQNRGYFPPTIDQLAATMPGGAGASIFVCPACGANPAKPPVLVTNMVRSHYLYAPPAARISQVKQPGRVVLAYEPPGHHDNGGINVLFCDGHVEFLTGVTVPKIVAELTAGQNPPPSKP